MIRFMFQTLHDLPWSSEFLEDALLTHALTEADRWIGEEVYQPILDQIDDEAMGRPAWVDALSS